MALDQLEALARVEPLHHHHRRAEALHRHRVDDRRRVVERRGGEVHRARTASEGADPLCDLDRCRRGIAERRFRQGLADPLRTTCRPRGVQHLAPLTLVLQRAGHRAVQHLVVALEVRELPDGRDAHGDAREVEPGDDVGHRLGGDERDRATVVDHVLHLVGAKMAVDRGVVELGALRGPGDLEVAQVVLHEDGDVVAGCDATRAKRPGQATRAVLQLGIGRRSAVRPHDDGRGVRCALGMPARRHRPGCASVAVHVPHGPAWYRPRSPGSAGAPPRGEGPRGARASRLPSGASPRSS